MTAIPLDTELKIIIYILAYLLSIGVVLALGISLCMYIDHRRHSRTVVSDVEENFEEKEEETECEEKDEEFRAALLASQAHSHQDRYCRPITDLQSCSYVDGRSVSLGSKYGATTPPPSLGREMKLGMHRQQASYHPAPFGDRYSSARSQGLYQVRNAV